MTELNARVKRLGKQLEVLPKPRLQKGDLVPEFADGPVEVRARWRHGPLALAFLRHFG